MSDIDGLHHIELDFVGATVLETDTGRVLVDTGIIELSEKLTGELERIGGVDLVILTHCHIDHVGGLPALGDVKVAAHPVDADLLAQGETSRGLIPSEHCPPDLREQIKHKPTVDPIEVDIRLNDGDTVPGFPSIKVLHTPGHTAGHISLLWDNGAGGVLVVGDAAAHFGQVVPPPVAEDFDTVFASLAKLAGLQFEAATFGHGPVIASGGTAAFAAFAGATA
jgi:glyoxylase-like metal-dependent hydrolase (beta-lactamase superfamily II)